MRLIGPRQPESSALEMTKKTEGRKRGHGRGSHPEAEKENRVLRQFEGAHYTIFLQTDNDIVC